MVERLATRLRESPDDIEGWKLLGRSYSALGRFPESATAYAKAAVLEPRDAQLLADFADVLAMAQGQRLEGEPEKLIARALELDPKNLKASRSPAPPRTRARTTPRRRRSGKRCCRSFTPTRRTRAPSAPMCRKHALAGIKEEKKEATRAVKGTVSIHSKVKSNASPEDTVFIFARAVEGPPMPLAVQRVKVRELPVAFALDDSMAMAPGMSLSAHPRVVVVARVSRTGSPAAQPGDLQGASARSRTTRAASRW